MDEKWFKQRQKKVGVTAEDIAQSIGRDRSAVSKIYSGHRAMSLEWAKAFAEVLQTPLSVVLEKAGIAEPQVTRQLVPGFADSDAAVWQPKGAEDRTVPAIAEALSQRAGVDVWQIRTRALSLMGYMPGDYMLVDTHAAERTRAGDVVVAQIYDNTKGAAITVLRRLEPPVLVAASPDPNDHRVHVVDGVNVVIRGKIIASWRA